MYQFFTKQFQYAVMYTGTWDPRPRTWCPRPQTHIKPSNEMKIQNTAEMVSKAGTYQLCCTKRDLCDIFGHFVFFIDYHTTANIYIACKNF